MDSSSPSPPSSSPATDGKFRNWAELPPELISSILNRLDAMEILVHAQKVCRSWRRVCKDPSMWRKIDIRNLPMCDYDYVSMCRHAVDRSQGGLVEIEIWEFGSDDLLNYIADRSSNLKSLRLVMCDSITDEGFIEAVVKLPLLEELEISHCSLSGESLRIAGQSCPNLKTLKLSCSPDTNFNALAFNNDEALAIAENMPGLLHLQLSGNRLTNTGLDAILDGCSHLEQLKIHKCLNINLVSDVDQQCSDTRNL